jgi:uncharacterized protein (DUF58 family)
MNTAADHPPSSRHPVIPSSRHPVIRSWRVPREGLLWLAVAATLLAVGLFKTINLLALLGCMLLAVWCLNAFLAGRCLRRLTGRRWIGRPVVAGQPTEVAVEVTNPEEAAVPALWLEDHGSAHRLSWFVPDLGGRQTRRFTSRVVLPARGRSTWGPLLAVSGYPFGLVQHRQPLTPPAEVIVWPRLGRLYRGRLRQYLPRYGLARDRIRRETRMHPTAHTDFHGLRAFRSGDSPRWIHWRTSARCGELMVREFEDVPTDDLILVVDPARAARTPPGAVCPDLEAIVSLAATICWEWCKQRGDRLVLLVAGDNPVLLDGLAGPEFAHRLLDCLAVLEAQPCRALDPAPVLRRLEGQALPAGGGPRPDHPAAGGRGHGGPAPRFRLLRGAPRDRRRQQ